MVTVKAVKHADIRGKELLYLVASNGTTEVVVNVGEKTYNAVLALYEQPTAKLSIDTKVKK